MPLCKELWNASIQNEEIGLVCDEGALKNGVK